MALLGGAFREMAPALALSILAPRLSWSEAEGAAGAEAGAAIVHGDGTALTPYDLKRLQVRIFFCVCLAVSMCTRVVRFDVCLARLANPTSPSITTIPTTTITSIKHRTTKAYSSNLVDYHLALDLVPPLAAAYLAGRVPATLSYGQAAILLTLGLQRRELSEVEAALGLPANQVLALFNKAVKKLHAHLRAAKEAAVARALPKPSAAAAAARALPLGGAAGEGLDEELEAAAAEVQARLRAQFDPAELAQYAVKGADEDFARALGGAAPGSGGIVQVKSAATPGGGGGGKKGASTPDASLYKRQQGGGSGKKHKTPGGGSGGKSAKKHKKG